ncbi:MAG: winged helix-turn-helix transcriptional regulator [Blastocatellia bacterium]|nr:winged helix-turn-helix transcriptional regulator [Blastocatellia bacterium]
MGIKKTKKQRSPVEQMAEECIAVQLRTLTRAVTRIYNRALRPYGLTISQMNILVAVAYLGEARQQDVCRVLHLEKSTLSRDIERMRDNGWIENFPGADARTILLRTTAAGKKLLEKTSSAWQQAQLEAVTLLGEENSAGLSRAVASIRSMNSDDAGA